MNLNRNHELTQQAVKKKFGRKRYLRCRGKFSYPQAVEREYIRTVNRYLRPLPAMRAAKVSGQLIAALAPVFAGIAPLLGENSGEASQLDVGAIAEGLGMLDENKLDSLIRALLFSYGNVAVETEGKVVSLTEDLVNELFCGEVQDLFLLCGYVVQENFQSFFRKWSSLSGAQNLLRRIQT